MKVANTSASSHALRSSTRRKRTASPTTAKKRGYDDRICIATVRAAVLVSPSPSMARNTGVITKGCDCPGRCTVRVTVSPGCESSHVRYNNWSHAAAEAPPLSVDGNDPVIRFQPSLFRRAVLVHVRDFEPCSERTWCQSLFRLWSGKAGERSTSTPRCRVMVAAAKMIAAPAAAGGSLRRAREVAGAMARIVRAAAAILSRRGGRAGVVETISASGAASLRARMRIEFQAKANYGGLAQSEEREARARDHVPGRGTCRRPRRKVVKSRSESMAQLSKQGADTSLTAQAKCAQCTKRRAGKGASARRLCCDPPSDCVRNSRRRRRKHSARARGR